jgi:hypothetical protein
LVTEFDKPRKQPVLFLIGCGYEREYERSNHNPSDCRLMNEVVAGVTRIRSNQEPSDDCVEYCRNYQAYKFAQTGKDER